MKCFCSNFVLISVTTSGIVLGASNDGHRLPLDSDAMGAPLLPPLGLRSTSIGSASTAMGLPPLGLRRSVSIASTSSAFTAPIRPESIDNSVASSEPYNTIKAPPGALSRTQSSTDNPKRTLFDPFETSDDTMDAHLSQESPRVAPLPSAMAAAEHSTDGAAMVDEDETEEYDFLKELYAKRAEFLTTVEEKDREFIVHQNTIKTSSNSSEISEAASELFNIIAEMNENNLKYQALYYTLTLLTSLQNRINRNPIESEHLNGILRFYASTVSSSLHNGIMFYRSLLSSSPMEESVIIDGKHIQLENNDILKKLMENIKDLLKGIHWEKFDINKYSEIYEPLKILNNYIKY